MNETSTQNVESQNQNLLVKRRVDRAALKRDVTVALFLVYYILILTFAWATSGLWWWRREDGLMWSSGGPGRFFPLPALPGMATVITPASLVDQVFYLVFMHGGIWIAWIALGLLYLFSPYRLDVRLLLDKVRTRLQYRSRG